MTCGLANGGTVGTELATRGDRGGFASFGSVMAVGVVAAGTAVGVGSVFGGDVGKGARAVSDGVDDGGADGSVLGRQLMRMAATAATIHIIFLAAIITSRLQDSGLEKQKHSSPDVLHRLTSACLERATRQVYAKRPMLANCSTQHSLKQPFDWALTVLRLAGARLRVVGCFWRHCVRASALFSFSHLTQIIRPRVVRAAAMANAAGLVFVSSIGNLRSEMRFICPSNQWLT